MSSSLLVLVVVVFLATATTNAKGPPFRKDEYKSANRDDLKNFRFTQPTYNATVPENSLASTLVLPSTEQLQGSKSSSPQQKMGVWNPSQREVKYSIVGGDPYSMFRAESLQIGDFSFLLLRVRNNERILNREFKELYKLQVKAELLETVKPFDNTSLIKPAPLFGELVFSPPEETEPIQPTTTTENLFIISEDLINPKKSQEGTIIDLKDPFSLQESSALSPPPTLKSKRKAKQKREKDEEEESSDIFSSATKAPRKRGLKRTSRDEKVNPSLNGTKSRPSKGRGGGRRNKNRGSKNSQEILSGGGLNEIKVDEVYKSVTVRTTNNNFVPNYKKTTTTSTTQRSTTTTTKKPLSSKVGGVTVATAETIITIRIKDIDDNQPVFESTHLEINVNEDAPVLSKVAKITAADADIGRNSEIYYSLVEWNDEWSVDPITGVLSPTRPLLGRSKDRDRETVIRVRARNRWNTAPNSGSIANVKIHVRPVNRYAPQIRANRPSQVEIRAYGVIYAVVSIRDADPEAAAAGGGMWVE